MQRTRVRHTFNSGAGKAWFVPGGQHWRKKAPELIEQTQIVQLTEDIAAPFHQQSGNTLRTEFFEHVEPTDPLLDQGAIPIFIGQQDRIGGQVAGPRHDDAPWLCPAGACPHV